MNNALPPITVSCEAGQVGQETAAQSSDMTSPIKFDTVSPDQSWSNIDITSAASEGCEASSSTPPSHRQLRPTLSSDLLATSLETTAGSPQSAAASSPLLQNGPWDPLKLAPRAPRPWPEPTGCSPTDRLSSPLYSPSAPWDPLGIVSEEPPNAETPGALALPQGNVRRGSDVANSPATNLANIRRAARAMPRFQLKPLSEWVQDEVVTHCVSCQTTFTLFNRKHHCRVCGHIFCHFCSSKTLPMPAPSYESVRVCDNCYADHQLAIVKNEFERKVENCRDRGVLSPLTREVMERIFSFLPLSTVVHLAPLVSRDFYFLARSNPVWKPLYDLRWRAPQVANQQPNVREINWLYYQVYQRQHLSDEVMSNARLRLRVKTLLAGSIKMFLIGAPGIGKTCLLQRFLTGEYRRQPFGTVGVSVRSKLVQIFVGDIGAGAKPVTVTMNPNVNPAAGPVTNLVFYDASGDPRYKTLWPLYYSCVHIVCVFFDYTAPQSFDLCQQWCKLLQGILPPDVVVAVCGLKSDAVHRTVDPEAMQRLPFRHDFCYDCSALGDLNVASFFEACVSACVQKVITTPHATIPVPSALTPVDILSSGRWQW